MTKKNPSSKRIIAVLFVLAVVCFLAYLLPIGGALLPFVIKLRLKKLCAYCLVAISASLATISFQTITGNRFLMPSVLGLENLYVLMQSTYLFFYWHWSQEEPNAIVEFIIVLAIQLIFFFFLQPSIKKLLEKGFGTILLICMSLGTLFRSLSTFMQVLMDPNEYDKLQSKLFASFQNANSDVLVLVAILVLFTAICLYRKSAELDVFYLGRETATLLGIDVPHVQRQVLWFVVLLTSASTAMVGPLTFFGFIVANVAYQIMPDSNHKTLFTATSLLGFIMLVVGQSIVERLFNYSVTISMVIEFCGGGSFFYLLYKERIKP